MLKSVMTICLFLFVAHTASSGTLEGVTLPDKIEMSGTSLELNGMTIRYAKVLGMNFKVYVGGLYLQKKSKNPNEILSSTTPKRIVMQYVRNAPKKKIKKAWHETFDEQCGSECKSEKKHLKTFETQIQEMDKKDKMILDFIGDKLIVKLEKGKAKSQSEINSKKFANIILKAFVKSKNTKFSKALLGN